MGFLDTLKKAISNTDFFAFTTTSKDVEGNLPIYPEWFFTARIGQPRNINVQEVRQFAQSPWVQMVLNTIKKEISTIDWDIVPEDEEENPDLYKEDIKKCKEFLNKINSDNEHVNDLSSMIVTDLGEIDAGALVKVFTLNSYEMVEEPRYDDQGNVIGMEETLKLKPLGERELLEVRPADGSTFLKQIDIYRRLLNYWQYSFKNPRTSPKQFRPDEVIYFQMNKKSYTLYGYSPVQAVMQVLETLLQATRWNKDFFKNNMIPDGIVSLPGANPEQMKNFKKEVEKALKGKAHKVLFQNSEAKFEAFMKSARDMEWLEGQKWYFHLVFAVFGVSPVEAGFHENVNQGNQAGQERITVKNGVKPFLQVFEEKYTRELLPEILQKENPGLKFTYKPREHVEEQIEFNQNLALVQNNVITPNEFRKVRGLAPIEGGDEVTSVAQSSQPQSSPQQDPANEETDAQKKRFKKRFEAMVNGKR